ncbi:MAG: hypothetical protein AVDCRST_MAG50-2266, partial [uncultured Acidimicrobiales bacterium]
CSGEPSGSWSGSASASASPSGSCASFAPRRSAMRRRRCRPTWPVPSAASVPTSRRRRARAARACGSGRRSCGRSWNPVQGQPDPPS